MNGGDGLVFVCSFVRSLRDDFVWTQFFVVVVIVKERSRARCRYHSRLAWTLVQTRVCDGLCSSFWFVCGNGGRRDQGRSVLEPHSASEAATYKSYDRCMKESATINRQDGEKQNSSKVTRLVGFSGAVIVLSTFLPWLCFIACGQEIKLKTGLIVFADHFR